METGESLPILSEMVVISSPKCSKVSMQEQAFSTEALSENGILTENF